MSMYPLIWTSRRDNKNILNCFPVKTDSQASHSFCEIDDQVLLLFLKSLDDASIVIHTMDNELLLKQKKIKNETSFKTLFDIANLIPITIINHHETINGFIDNTKKIQLNATATEYKHVIPLQRSFVVAKPNRFSIRSPTESNSCAYRKKHPNSAFTPEQLKLLKNQLKYTQKNIIKTEEEIDFSRSLLTRKLLKSSKYSLDTLVKKKFSLEFDATEIKKQFRNVYNIIDGLNIWKGMIPRTLTGFKINFDKLKLENKRVICIFRADIPKIRGNSFHIETRSTEYIEKLEKIAKQNMLITFIFVHTYLDM
jgi:hypothetical protein